MSWTYLGNSKLQLLSCRKGIQAARKASSNWHLERFTPASTRMKGMPKQMQAIWQPYLAFRVMWSGFMWGAEFPCSPGPTCWSSNIIKKAPWVWDCCNGKHGSTRREWGNPILVGNAAKLPVISRSVQRSTEKRRQWRWHHKMQSKSSRSSLLLVWPQSFTAWLERLLPFTTPQWVWPSEWTHRTLARNLEFDSLSPRSHWSSTLNRTSSLVTPKHATRYCRPLVGPKQRTQKNCIIGPIRAAPRPASFSLSKMDSGEEQQATGQCTWMTSQPSNQVLLGHCWTCENNSCTAHVTACLHFWMMLFLVFSPCLPRETVLTCYEPLTYLLTYLLACLLACLLARSLPF